MYLLFSYLKISCSTILSVILGCLIMFFYWFLSQQAVYRTAMTANQPSTGLRWLLAKAVQDNVEYQPALQRTIQVHCLPASSYRTSLTASQLCTGQR